MPSRRRQMSTIAGAFCSVILERWLCRGARSINSLTASNCVSDRHGNGQRLRPGRQARARHTSFRPAMCSASRLDVRNLARRIRTAAGCLATSAHACTRCSQLSRTIRSSASCDELHQRIDDRATRFLLDAEHRRDGLRHEALVCQCREFDEPHTIRIVVQYVGSNLQRQPRLAKATDAKQRQQSRLCPAIS